MRKNLLAFLSLCAKGGHNLLAAGVSPAEGGTIQVLNPAIPEKAE